MQTQYDTLQEKGQDGSGLSQQTAVLLEEFLLPLLMTLDTLLDKRLVRTFIQCCVAILRFRNTTHGLLLSELGSYLDGYAGLSVSAPAGTKRISNLLRSIKWTVLQIDQFLIQEADKEVRYLRSQGKRVLCIWDGSVLEKPESQKAEGICAVVSSKAKRRNRSKKGYVFNFPPGKAITVTGMQWTGMLIAGMEGRVKVALMRWWTTKGDYATNLRAQEEEMLRICVRQWGNDMLHIFDRGYVSAPWVHLLETLHAKFVIRWKKGLYMIDAQGSEKKLWQIGRGKKYLAHKLIRDMHTGQKMPCDLWWAPVRHAECAQQMYVVKARVKNQIWYLLTNEKTGTEEQAWEIFFAYRRRWQIELSFRYGKSELAMESPRLWFFENRLKLLGMVTLVYAFLLHLLEPGYLKIVEAILLLKCHRTGKWRQVVVSPLYRVRWALSRLWEQYRPLLGSFLPPNLESIQALASLKC